MAPLEIDDKLNLQNDWEFFHWVETISMTMTAGDRLKPTNQIIAEGGNLMKDYDTAGLLQNSRELIHATWVLYHVFPDTKRHTYAKVVPSYNTMCGFCVYVFVFIYIYIACIS